jgi:hypothetical protein
MCAPLTFAKCCSIFSFTGIIFLTIIGWLLQTQPMYIKGPEDPETAAAGCYGGAGIYFATMVGSLMYWHYAEKKTEDLASTRAPGGYENARS